MDSLDPKQNPSPHEPRREPRPDARYERDESPGVGLADLSGRQMGRYLIGQQLGSGGVATVYRAFDQVQGQTVALKVLLPNADEKSYNRFRREALTAGGLRHPNIVRILQVGTAPQGGVAYIAMELVEGESLADLLAQRRALSYGEACALLAPIADALAYAHAAGIVHRDVKPSNILLRPVGRSTPGSVQPASLDYPVVPLLSDFGIARTLDAPELTSAGRTVGTPAYMAPEQAAGSRTIDGRADIYALGTVLYRCITGRLPFAGTATQILHAHVYEPLTIDTQLLSQLPPELVAVLQRALAKRPEERYQTAAPLAQALQGIAATSAAVDGPLALEGDPAATRTMGLPAAAGGVPAPLHAAARPPSASVLVPGTLPTVEAVAASRTLSASVPPGNVPPDPAAVEGSAGPNRRLWVMLASVTMVVLLLGLSAGAVTAFLRSRERAEADPAATVALLPATGTATPTPSATPTPWPTLAPATQPPDQPPPVVVIPEAPTPTAPPIFVPPPDTPTPEPPTATPTPEPPTEAPPTETPTETASPSPSPSPSPTPTLEPPTPTLEPPTPTDIPPTPTPEPPTPTPGSEGCSAATDFLFDSTIAGFDDGARAAFACALAPAQESSAELLTFQNGFMLHIGDRAEVYASLTDGTWVTIPSGWRPGDPEPPVTAVPPEGLYAPTGIFGAIWQEPLAQQLLGYALTPTPAPLRALEQSFPGGTLVGDLDTGVVYVFRGDRMVQQ